MKFIDLYVETKMKEIEHRKDEAIIAIKTEDPVYAALRGAKKAIKHADDVVSLRGYTFPKEVNDRIEEVRKTMAKEIAELNEFVREVNMMVNLADENKDKLAVLKTYGIID